MALRILNNISSSTIQLALDKHDSSRSQSIQRRSSGLKTNRGADGPDVLEISDQQRAQVASVQKDMGTFQVNASESNARNLMTSLENTAAPETAVLDADLAAEMASVTKLYTTMQASPAALQNINQTSQLVLRLLG